MSEYVNRTAIGMLLVNHSGFWVSQIGKNSVAAIHKSLSNVVWEFWKWIPTNGSGAATAELVLFSIGDNFLHQLKDA